MDEIGSSQDRSTGSRTLARGLSVLDVLSRNTTGLTVSGLAEHTGLDRAVLYRLLDTLLAGGYVRKDASTRRYLLGVAVLELGIKAGQSLEVRRLAEEPLHTLSVDTGEVACLVVQDRTDVVVVAVNEPNDRFIQVNYRVGYRHPLGVAAHGKALLAFLPEGAKRAELNGVRQRGVAFTRDEIESGAGGVAAPVFGHHGGAVAAVGIVAPSSRLGDPDVLAIRVLRTAREISERLGWRPRRSS